MKKMQIFVSSTYEDLKDERQEMVEAILEAGHIPAGMELFSGAGTVIRTIQKWIDESDIYFLLLGGRYGSIYNKEGISFTEWEYNYALSVNKPVCIIALDESMLFAKAAKDGKDKVFEKEHLELYHAFRKKVLEGERLHHIINSMTEISGIVQSNIREVLADDEYELVGWVPGNSYLRDWKKASNEILESTYKEVLGCCISNFYGKVDMEDFSKQIGENVLEITRAKGIINKFHRIVQFYKYTEELIKVVIADEFEYRYLEKENPTFGKRFQATKQQADTYKIEKLLVNNCDYTDEFEMESYKNDNRGQLKYYVQSKKSIPMGNEFPVHVYYKSSYVCPPLDFFQTSGVSYPCKNYCVDLYLCDGLDEKYSIVSSTHSSFSSMHSDSFRANEMKNFGSCNIQLPEWVLASSGYVATLKRKSENNH